MGIMVSQISLHRHVILPKGEPKSSSSPITLLCEIKIEISKFNNYRSICSPAQQIEQSHAVNRTHVSDRALFIDYTNHVSTEVCVLCNAFNEVEVISSSIQTQDRYFSLMKCTDSMPYQIAMCCNFQSILLEDTLFPFSIVANYF